MKTRIINRLIWVLILMTGWFSAQAQRQMEVPGDNFSLEGALELFKKSGSPEEFERMLNDPDSRVNNLDLNGDGYIDYIRVIDMYEGNVHAFILQSVISERESQDIAVITLEKLANGKAVLQITGDEDIYGVETIIEPTSEVRTYGGTTSTRVVVNVWGWPMVRYIYGPYYSVWVSPWGWRYRPYWYHPWRPVVYYDYYSYWSPYRHYYTVCYTHRVVYAHHFYRPHRTTSVIVHKRHYDRITHYRSTHIDTDGRYRYNESRSNSRQTSNAVRYDANGRIRPSSNQNLRTSSSANERTLERGIEGNRRSTSYQNSDLTRKRPESNIRTGQNSSQQRYADYGKSSTSGNTSGSTNRNNGVIKEQRTSARMESNRTSGNSNTQRYERGSSSTPGSGRSVNQSSGSSQRSSTGTNVQRSTERSSGSSNIQRSSGRSSSNANIQRSTSSSNVQRSTGSSSAHRSSGSSNVQNSSGRSSSSANIQRSTGRSSGNSNAQRSSGSTDTKRSDSSKGQSRGRH